MIRQIELKLPVDIAFDETRQNAIIKKKLRISETDRSTPILKRRSLDARKREIVYVLQFDVYINEEYKEDSYSIPSIKLDESKSALIVGAGPAGLFAAIRLLQEGIKPIILERGKDVKSRRRDLVNITRNINVDPDSNYCFGEGGAGTYSDGKLYTRSKKRGNVKEILEILVHFGAHPSILIDAHPHIGTNKLPEIIENMRKFILESGGEVHFETRVCDLIIEKNKIVGLIDQNEKHFNGDDVILATGHSANDIYELLYAKSIALEQKDFALGVRVEHPQELIDQMQYHCDTRSDYLPPASYNLVSRNDDKGAYSFCMCPGGIIAPCATSNEEIVTNGWSPSKRNNPFANSGIVVPIHAADTREFTSWGPLAGLKFRQKVERKCWEKAGKSQTAPAQRLQDFLKDRKSELLPDCSYAPGVVSIELKEVLPKFVISSLRRSFRSWKKRMPRFIHKDAILVAVESRTSSPVRIPRDKDNLQHPELSNLYPCGEGAGYAGGIVSAAIDGMRCAEQIAVKND